MEHWRDVVGYSRLYMVSDIGRIKSVDRVVRHYRGGPKNLKGKILQLVPNNRVGHLIVTLCKNGIERTVTVHRVVAEAWIGPCPDGCEVRHGYAGTADNSVRNLCYGTHSQNEHDKRRDGTSGGISVVRSDGRVYASMPEGAEDSGCYSQHIWRCCNGIRKTTGGFGWHYNTDCAD